MLNLNHISKIKLFKEIKKIVNKGLNDGKISLERGKEIFDYVKKNLIIIKNDEEMAYFYKYLGNKYIELKPIVYIFDNEQEEKNEEIINLFIEEIINTGNIDEAEYYLTELQKKGKTEESIISLIKANHPNHFKKIVKKIVNNL